MSATDQMIALQSDWEDSFREFLACGGLSTTTQRLYLGRTKVALTLMANVGDTPTLESYLDRVPTVEATALRVAWKHFRSFLLGYGAEFEEAAADITTGRKALARMAIAADVYRLYAELRRPPANYAVTDLMVLTWEFLRTVRDEQDHIVGFTVSVYPTRREVDLGTATLYRLSDETYAALKRVLIWGYPNTLLKNGHFVGYDAMHYEWPILPAKAAMANPEPLSQGALRATLNAGQKIVAPEKALRPFQRSPYRNDVGVLRPETAPEAEVDAAPAQNVTGGSVGVGGGIQTGSSPVVRDGMGGGSDVLTFDQPAETSTAGGSSKEVPSPTTEATDAMSASDPFETPELPGM
jgi:hypothetical protein